MGTDKSKEQGQAKEKAPSMSEMVSEARIRITIEEEEKVAASDAQVALLKAETSGILREMEEARAVGDEVKRRELRNEVIVKNLRLVTRVLSKYGFFNPDKFQNGCIGLLKAAETYDSERGVPFWNYAAFCIETEVRLAFKRVNRMFESKKQGFLQSLDAATNSGGEDKEINAYETVADPYSEQEFDVLIDEAETDTLFYDIIIPCIEEYGQRAKDIDMVKWRALEIQYFIELSMENSQRQRLTFTEMAKQLGTVPQNLRVRHKKVMELVRARCKLFGYDVAVSEDGRTSRIVQQEVEALKKLEIKTKKK